MSILRAGRLSGIVLFSFLLVVTAGAVFAQATPTETFTSAFHALTFQYPADWLVEESGANEVVIASTARALALVDEEFAAPGPGDVLIRLNITAPSMSGDQWTPTEMLEELTGALEEAMMGVADFSDIESVTIGDLNGARMTMSSEMLGFDTLMVTAETGNRMVTFVSATTALGEIPQFEQAVLDILASTSTEDEAGTPAPAPVVTLAAPPSGELGTFASPNEIFTFEYPVEWEMNDGEEGDERVLVTNIVGAFDDGGPSLGWDFVYPSGTVYVVVSSGPAGNMTVRGLSNGVGFVIAPELGEGAFVDELIAITVDGQPGYRVDAGSESKALDVMFLNFEVDDQIATIIAMTKAGEMQDFESQIMAIAESVEPATAQPSVVATPTAGAPASTPIPVKGATAVPPEPVVQSLQYGQSVTGERTGAQPSQWQFTGAAGDLVSIRMTADFDTYLELHDSSGNVVTQDDDSGGELNAFIRAFRLPESDTYTIVASAFEPAAAGPYRLELIQETPATSSSLEIGVIVNGNLDGAFNEWTFQGAAGDTVNILLTGEFDTILEVFAPDGSLVASNDDLLAVNVSYVENVALPAAGVYVVRVSSYEDEEQGLYLLTLGQTP